MIHIVSDSSALHSRAQAEKAGFHTVPLTVMVDGESFEDFETITPAQMNACCRSRKNVSTSQPAIGSKIELYDRLLTQKEDLVLDITMADGLSGTYQSALLAKQSCTDPERVYVVNSRTLCGPHRDLVLKAVEMRDAARSMEEILQMLEKSSATELSTVTVPDIAFVLKGGRLGRAAGRAGEMLRLMPIVKKTAEDTSLSVHTAVRTFRKAAESVFRFFEKNGMDASYSLSITHADNPQLARKCAEIFRQAMPGLKITISELCPLFIAHGGPGCIAMQAIQIRES